MINLKLYFFYFVTIIFTSQSVRCQYNIPPSPCPNYFSYVYDMQQQLMGRIHITPGATNMLTIKANFTIKAPISAYVGRIDVRGNQNQVLKDVMYGRSPITYNVHFPTVNPVPKLMSLTVNGNVICYGEPDRARPGEVVTSISLDHVLFTTSAGGSKPMMTFDDIPLMTSTNKDPMEQNGIIYYDGGNILYDIKDEMFPISNINVMPTKKKQTTAAPTMQFIPMTRPQTTTTQQTMLMNPERMPSFVTESRVECGVKAGGNDLVTLVYNGDETTRGDWPWLVAIYQKKGSGIVFICAGSLISNEHVITAAHCLHQKTRVTNTADIVVKLGVHNLQDWGDDNVETRAVKTADVHKLYNAVTIKNDIMIMTLSRRVEYTTFIRPVCIWNSDPSLDPIVGKDGTVIGWGNSELGIGGQGEPRRVTIPIVSTATCRAKRPDFFKLTSDTTLCAGDLKGSGPCNGDSGGGLYLQVNGRWSLRGIVSLSLKSEIDNSCNLNEYVVFTDAAKYGGWIRQYVFTD